MLSKPIGQLGSQLLSLLQGLCLRALKFSDTRWIDNEFQDSGAQQLGNQPKHSDILQIGHQSKGSDTLIGEVN